MVSDKDVVLGVAGAASATGGLLLVFLALLISIIQGFDSEMPETEVRPYRIVATGAGGSFLLSLASLSCAVWWLVGNQASWSYYATVWLFTVQVAAMVVVVVWTLSKIVWGD